jgi:hypothetical protein
MIRVAVGVAAFACLMVCAIRGAVMQSEVFARVNERLPPEERISWLRPAAAFRACEDLFSDDPRVEKLRTLRRVGIVAWVLFVLCLVVPW